MSHYIPPDSEITQMIIPVSKGTFFNTNWKPKQAPLCAYDMLYHPPDYNPKSARSDRQEPKIIRRNIWDQDFTKSVDWATNFKMILAPQDCGCPLVVEGASIVDSSTCPGTYLFMIMLQAFLRGQCDIVEPCRRVQYQEELESEYDFIVVGAGAAGPIVASRLSEDESFNVLLLEAGGPEPVGGRVPSFYTVFWESPEVSWQYRTIPSTKYCLDQGKKGCNWPRGKALGGSTLLNGMMYHRGHPADYEDWVKAGATGWSWEENLKYFDMTEGNKQIGELVSEKYHSDSGPLPVQNFNYQPDFIYDLLNAINETGLPVIADMNDPKTPAGFMVAQTFNDNGQRYTTARAFLKPKSERPNLTVKTNSLVSKVIFDGKRAVGVEYIAEDGQTRTVRANKEVILSAGALNTPQILMLSGVGPQAELKRHSIPIIADLPVGENLRNHIGGVLYFVLKAVNNTRVLNWGNAAEYLLNRKGPMSGTGITQLTGLLYSSLADTSRDQPDLQFFFNGFYADCSHTGVVGEPANDCPENGFNITANMVALLPRSVGYIALNTTDPRDAPLFYPNYFADPDDMVMVKDAARYLKRIFETKALEKFGLELDREANKACSKSGEEWSDDWLECMIRVNTDPQNHQMGTAAMGYVIDPELKVYGLEGLRVIDASSIPTLVTGNPQGAIMMVAERGAADIRRTYATQ